MKDIKIYEEITTLRDTEEVSYDGEVDLDYEFQRRVYHEIISKGMETLDKMEHIVVDELKDPSSFLKYFLSLKGVADINDKLSNLHLSRSKIKKDKMILNSTKKIEENNITQNNVTNNAIFVGTSKDLLRTMMDKDIDEIVIDNNGN